MNLFDTSTVGLIRFVIQLAFVGIMIYAVHWFLGILALPEPVKMVVYFIVALIGLIFLLRLLGIMV